MLNRLDHIPAGLLALDATQLHDALGGPTLIELPGRQEPELFLSVLMHGNETTGWDAVRDLLGNYVGETAKAELPRSLTLFIGNTLAAKHNVRHMHDQPDYNRVWPGTELPDCAEQQMMQQVVDIVSRHGVFASVDLHNNTGLNPHYACVNCLEHEALHLATMFNRTVVYFIRPTGVQSIAMSRICPAVTLECGRVGNELGVQHAREFVDACLHLNAHPSHPVAPQDIDLFHTTAIVKVPQDTAFGYHGDDLELKLITDLDHYNFRELSKGTPFGSIANGTPQPLLVSNERGEDVYDEYFEVDSGVIRTRIPVMPSMLTLDTEVIRQDCLCYLMERYTSPSAGNQIESAP